MKIIFYSQDAKLRSLAERLLNIDWSFCDQLDELKFEYEQQPEDEVWVYFLDFACSVKLIDQFSKLSFKNVEALRIGLIEAEDFKDIRKHQKTKLACHTYLLKPIEIAAMQEAIESYLKVQGFEIEGSGSFQLDLETDCEVAGLDEDKEDYDTTESRLVLPDGFRETPQASQDEGLPKEIRATYIANQSPKEKKSMRDEDFDDDNNEVFEAQEFKIHDDVKNLVNEHTNLHSRNKFDDDPVCQKIQQKFSKVFGDGHEPSIQDELMINESSSPGLKFDDDVLMEDEESIKDQSVSINFSVDEDPVESQMEPVMSQSPRENNSPALNDDDDDDGISGLDFDMPDDSAIEATMTSSNEVQLDEVGQNLKEADYDDDQLKFESTGENDIEKVLSENRATDDQEDEGLVFDLDDVIETNSKSSKKESEPINLDDEDEFSLDTFDQPASSAASKELDFSDDDSQFDLSAAGGLPVEGDDEGFGELSFEQSEEDEAIDPTVVGSIDTSSFNSGNSTSENLEKTISEIVQGPLLKNNEPVEETGEFELGGDLGFSNDELDEIGQNEGSDKTAATIIIDASASLRSAQVVEETSGDFDLESLIEEDASTTDFHVDSDVEETQGDVGFSVAPDNRATPIPARSSESRKVQEEYSKPMMSYNDDELLRLQSTIKSLREEREEHLRTISEQKNELKLQMSDSLGLKAELDEAKIEISIIKKRHQQDIEEYRYQLGLAEEKKQIFEERCKNFQKEFDRLNQKVRLEFNQVKQREKELESQLELVTMDSEAQVQARDNKILELKRKIDALEFNMENVTIREEKTREDKMKVEDKISKIMTTLRGSIKILEDDADVDEQLRVRLNDKQEK